MHQTLHAGLATGSGRRAGAGSATAVQQQAATRRAWVIYVLAYYEDFLTIQRTAQHSAKDRPSHAGLYICMFVYRATHAGTETRPHTSELLGPSRRLPVADSRCATPLAVRGREGALVCWRRPVLSQALHRLHSRLRAGPLAGGAGSTGTSNRAKQPVPSLRLRWWRRGVCFKTCSTRKGDKQVRGVPGVYGREGPVELAGASSRCACASMCLRDLTCYCL
jgi:hypothetical protein